MEPERRQWGPWNFVGFWIADSFNIVRSGDRPQFCHLLIVAEYLDDSLVYDRPRTFLVAVMALCVDRLSDLWYFHLYDWPHRGYLPHQLSCGYQGLVWNMGLVVACFQSSRNGLYLVRRPNLDWR